MRDHMIGWHGAVEQVNAWHPETRKEVRTQVVRAPVDQKARLAQDMDPAKLPKGPVEGKVYLTEVWNEDTDRVMSKQYFSRFSGGKWMRQSVLAKEAASYTGRSIHQNREIIREATSEELGLKAEEKKEPKAALITPVVGKVYLTKFYDGSRGCFSKYMNKCWMADRVTAKEAAQETKPSTFQDRIIVREATAEELGVEPELVKGQVYLVSYDGDAKSGKAYSKWLGDRWGFMSSTYAEVQDLPTFSRNVKMIRLAHPNDPRVN